MQPKKTLSILLSSLIYVSVSIYIAIYASLKTLGLIFYTCFLKPTFICMHMCISVCMCVHVHPETRRQVWVSFLVVSPRHPPVRLLSVTLWAGDMSAFFFPMWVLRIKHWFEDQKIPDWAVSPALEHTFFFSPNPSVISHFLQLNLKKNTIQWGWRDGLEFKSIWCFPEGPCLVPSTHMAVTCNWSSKRSYANFWDLWSPGMQVVHMYTKRQNMHRSKV